LRYEYEAYKDFKQRAPKCGTQVDLSDGTFGKIASMNVPREMLTVRVQGGPEHTVPLTALDCSAGRGCPCKLDVETLARHTAEAAYAHGTTPTLREAEKVPEAEGAQAPSPSRRKRRSSKGGGQGGSQADGQKQAAQGGSQGQKSGQKKSGGQQPRQRTEQSKPQGEGKPAQGAQSAQGTGTGTSRRRRRRRPRPEGGGTASE
ncbi:MAG: hypothetical protein JXE06_09695, partial [Coriobacteriia bacterium]|nr:hypothetical protein [Coriobacteriia bacterium]